MYDPAVPGYDEKPEGTFDIVICTDVMEHIEEQDVPAVLDNIFGYADKGVYLAICLREAKRLLPDGRNRHVTVKPQEWWLEKIGSRSQAFEVDWT